MTDKTIGIGNPEMWFMTRSVDRNWDAVCSFTQLTLRANGILGFGTSLLGDQRLRLSSCLDEDGIQ